MINVLIVDDESWTRDIIRAFGEWQELGMHIIGEAEDGKEALRLTEELQPQIVITDMRMPGLDGVQLLQQLNERHSQILTIVISGYDDFEYAKHALRNKAIDYLLKPVDPKELNAALLNCKKILETALIERSPLSLDLSYALSTYKQLLKSHYNDLNLEGVTTTLGHMMRSLRLRKQLIPR